MTEGPLSRKKFYFEQFVVKYIERWEPASAEMQYTADVADIVAWVVYKQIQKKKK